MSPFLTLIILAVAFGLSWYTAHAAGRFWTESKIVGGWARFMVIGSCILSAIGFTGVYFMVLLVGASLMNTPIADLDLRAFYPVSLGVLGTPGVGAAPNLWLNGQVMQRRQQMLGPVGMPGLQLPVDALDMLDLSIQSKGLFGDLFGGLFSGGGDGGGDSDSGKLVLILLVIAIAVLALCAGVVTTILIVQSADREHVGEIYDLYKSPGAATS